MSDFNNKQDFIEPELLPSQIAIHEICNEIIALKPEGNPLSFWNLSPAVDTVAVEQRLRESTLGDIMLKDGDSLSAPGDSDYYPDLGLYVGKSTLAGVMVRAWGWQFDKIRINPNGPSEPPYDVIKFDSETDWSRQLDISISYTNGTQHASQIVTMQTASSRPGIMPTACRDVRAMAYAEMGYEGHNQKCRPAHSEVEVLGFVALARELITEQ